MSFFVLKMASDLFLMSSSTAFSFGEITLAAGQNESLISV